MLKRIISLALVLTLSLMILPLDAKAAVNDETKGFVENLSDALTDYASQSNDVLPVEDAQSSGEVPSFEDIPDAMPPEESDIFESDTVVGNGRSVLSDYTNYQVSDDGAYIVFDTRDGSIVQFVQGSDENAYYDIVLPLEIAEVPVSSIHNGAFGNANRLKSIVIPDSVTYIGQEAFVYCSALEYVKLPKTLDAIHARTFEGCTALSEVVMPESCPPIKGFDDDNNEHGAFKGCSSLTHITFPADLNHIGRGVFNGCGFKYIEIPASVTSLQCAAFGDLEYAVINNPDTEFEYYYHYWGDDRYTPFTQSTAIFGYPGSTAEAFCQEYGNKFIDIAEYPNTKVINVSLQTTDGKSFPNKVSFRWYDADGNQLDDTSSRFFGEKNKGYFFEIDIQYSGYYNDTKYKNPGRIYVSPEETDVTVVIEDYITLTGKTVNKNGGSLSATITIEYDDEIAEEKYGSMSLQVPRQEIKITCSCYGYYDKKFVVDLTGAEGKTYDLGKIVLANAPNNMIALNAYITKAALPGEEAIIVPVNNIDSFDIAINNESNNNYIGGLKVQGTNIALTSTYDIDPYDTLRLSISDKSGKFVKPEDIYVTLDRFRYGKADLNLIEKGTFMIENSSGPDYRVLVYDAEGNLRLNSSSQINLPYDPLDAGDYTVVIIENSDLLKTIPSLYYLNQMGLVNGEDYYSTNINIQDGVITKISDVTVPTLNMSKFTYTGSDKTDFSVYGTSSVGLYNMFMLRGEYKIDPESNKTPKRVSIILPEGIGTTNLKTATVNGKPIDYFYNYNSYNNREIYFDYSETEVTFYVYATGLEAGDYEISAFISFESGEIQPLGTAAVNVKNDALEAPSKTQQKNIYVSGQAQPRSKVIIYDNGTNVGETTANEVGSWVMNIDLVEPLYNYSYHFLHAETSYYGENVVTDDVLVVYDANTTYLESIGVKYYTHGVQNSKEINFINGQRIDYIYWQPNTDVTFCAYFNEPQKVHDVFIVLEDSQGFKKYLSTVYDPETESWVCSCDDPFSGKIYAEYSTDDDGVITFDEEMIQEAAEDFGKLTDSIKDYVDSISEETYDVINIDGSSNTGTLVYNNPDTNEQEVQGNVHIETFDLDSNASVDSLIEDGYFPIAGGEINLWSKFYTDGDAAISEFVNLNTMTAVRMVIDFSQTLTFAASEIDLNSFKAISSELAPMGIDLENVQSNIAEWSDRIVNYGGIALESLDAMGKFSDKLKELRGDLGKFAKLGGVSDWAKKLKASNLGECASMLGWGLDGIEILHTNNKFIHLLSGCVSVLNENLDSLNEDLIRKCILENYPLLSDPDFRSGTAMVNEFGDKIDVYYASVSAALMSLLMTTISFYIMFQISDYLMGAGIQTLCTALIPGLGILVGFGTKTLTSMVVGKLCDKMIDDYKQTGPQIIEKPYNKLLESGQEIGNWIFSRYRECRKEPVPKDLNRTSSPCAPFAVSYDPSGYVYEAVPSNRLTGVTAVVSSEAGGVWNAEEYDQVNPQITGADGAYQWFVPQGNWKVDFTKEGYEDADTSLVPQAVNGWLPVPPPQIGINVGMVSKSAPTVEKSVLYSDGAEIKFSQYMDIESVMSSIKLTINGNVVDVRVEPLDAEKTEDGTAEYTTRFRAVPTSGNITSNGDISVSTDAKNYAGKALESAYEAKDLAPLQRPEKLIVSSKIPVVFHEKATFTVSLMPEIPGKTLTVENLSPDIVTTTDAAVVTGNDGTAEITVEGKLLGSGILRVTEPESGLSKDVIIEVSLQAAPEPVTVTLEDGTPLKSGAELKSGDKIILSTSTEGAIIRYTLDDTCPCEDTALTYTAPIIYTPGIRVIRAAAFKDGKYSSTVRIDLVSTYITGDLNSDGEVTVKDGVLMQRVLAELETDPKILALADLNADGEVTVKDGVKMQRILAKLE